MSLLTAKADPISTQPINPDALPAGLGVERCWPFDWLLANMNDLASTRMKNIAYRLFLTLVLLFQFTQPWWRRLPSEVKWGASWQPQRQNA